MESSRRPGDGKKYKMQGKIISMIYYSLTNLYILRSPEKHSVLLQNYCIYPRKFALTCKTFAFSY